jgi:hypothetical protein
MHPRFAAFLAFAAIAIGLIACAETPTQKAQLDPEALYEQRVEEGFGRLDALPSRWSRLPQDRAVQLLSTSRILAASPE